MVHTKLRDDWQNAHNFDETVPKNRLAFSPSIRYNLSYKIHKKSDAVNRSALP